MYFSSDSKTCDVTYLNINITNPQNIIDAKGNLPSF